MLHGLGVEPDATSRRASLAQHRLLMGVRELGEDRLGEADRAHEPDLGPVSRAPGRRGGTASTRPGRPSGRATLPARAEAVFGLLGEECAQRPFPGGQFLASLRHVPKR
jgi:hypothetical protein